MRHSLRLHPDSVCSAVTAITVDISRSQESLLALRYSVIGTIDGLRIPPAGAPERRDELWRHSCFEAFVRRDDASYVEFNFAPSRSWAAYAFDSYRCGMRPAEVDAPRIEIARRADRLEAEVLLGLVGLLPADGARRLGLSAVIEEQDGRISHWALAHPPGKADFHHEDCFAAQLPAARQP